jgi:hypothetical protein
LKLLVTATINGPSHNDVEQTRRSILKALDGVKDRMNNGSEMKIGSCNTENSFELGTVMRQIVAFSLGREPDGFSEHKRQASKRRRAGIVEESIDDILQSL